MKKKILIFIFVSILITIFTGTAVFGYMVFKNSQKRLTAKLLGSTDFHNPQKGVVETILARGDHRVGKLLNQAFNKGEIFSAWDKDFHYINWETLIEGKEYEKFLQQIPIKEFLPWEFIDVNYQKDYLIQELIKSTRACKEGTS